MAFIGGQSMYGNPATDPAYQEFLKQQADQAKVGKQAQDFSKLPYGSMTGMDQGTAAAIQDYLNSAGGGIVQLPANLQNKLTATYNPFKFSTPAAASPSETTFDPSTFTKGNFSDPSTFQNGSFTAPSAIKSVADLPDNIKQAIFESGRGQIGRTAQGQRVSSQDRLLQQGRGASGLNEAAQRAINQSEMESTGNLSVQAAIDEANRRIQEAQNVRNLGLTQEQVIAQNAQNTRAQQMAQEAAIANNSMTADQAAAANRLAIEQANMGQNQYMTGLADTTATRNAAEAEKKYNYDYGKQQDQINTIMNQASFNSGERQNQASREQAAIQQGLNYLNQGGTYHLNAQQLAQKGDTNMALMGGNLAQGVGGVVGNSTLNAAKNQPSQLTNRYGVQAPMKTQTYDAQGKPTR